MRHARAVMHVGIANPRWRGKRPRHSRRMHNPQFYVSGKRPMRQCMDITAKYFMILRLELSFVWSTCRWLSVRQLWTKCVSRKFAALLRWPIDVFPMIHCPIIICQIDRVSEWIQNKLKLTGLIIDRQDGARETPLVWVNHDLIYLSHSILMALCFTDRSSLEWACLGYIVADIRITWLQCVSNQLASLFNWPIGMFPMIHMSMIMDKLILQYQCVHHGR